METIWGSLPKRQGTTARPVSTLSSRESIPVLDHPVVFSCYTSIASSPRHWTLLYDLRKAATERKDDRSAKSVLRKNAAHRLPSLVVGAQSREPRRTRTSEIIKILNSLSLIHQQSRQIGSVLQRGQLKCLQTPRLGLVFRFYFYCEILLYSSHQCAELLCFISPPASFSGSQCKKWHLQCFKLVVQTHYW